MSEKLFFRNTWRKSIIALQNIVDLLFCLGLNYFQFVVLDFLVPFIRV